MHPILFTIGNFNFYTHGLVAVLGIILAAFVTNLLAKKQKLDTEFFFDNIVFTTLFGIIGARITYFVIYRDQFSSWKQIIDLQDGGLVSYGGFILGGLCFWLLLRKQKQPVLKWFDLFSVGFFLGLSLGRIGDLFAGEYNGVYSERSLGFIGAYNIVPVSFYEAILCFCIFLAMLLLYRKRSKRFLTGELLFTSVSLYSFGRFILDFWRTESKVFLSLSIGQIVSMVIFFISVILLIKVKREGRKNGIN